MRWRVDEVAVGNWEGCSTHPWTSKHEVVFEDVGESVLERNNEWQDGSEEERKT
jgi:hypothetical protein